MRYRASFALGAASGYVLGTRAGRERYDQIMRKLRSAKENPTVQETAGVLQAKAEDLTDTAKSKVSSVTSSSGTSSSGTSTTPGTPPPPAATGGSNGVLP